MKNSETTPMSEEAIEQAIDLIRGQKVMLDRDLAALYGVETRVLNQAVKRNADRFPDDFMFELTREEIQRISQTVTSSGNLKFSKSVAAFTEQGVAMLSGVLSSPRAVQVNVAIMRTFVRLRRMMEAHASLAMKLAEMEQKYDEQFKVVFEVLNALMAPPETERKPVGFSVRERRARYRARGANGTSGKKLR